MSATNFEEFVEIMADEAPHALALDWYRRLELTIRDYLTARRIDYKNGRNAENRIATDPLLGKDIAVEIGKLRAVRNGIAHTAQQFSRAEAIGFARKAFELIGVVLGAQDARAASVRC